MKNKTSIIQISVFLAFIALFFVLNPAIPDRDFSEQENRYLSQAPKFTFESLFSGDFTKEFESYISDQFAFRDRWTALKASCELAVGKKENKNICLCKTSLGPLDSMLIERFEAPAQSVITANVGAVNALADNAGVPVYFALIPGSAEIYSGLLPAGFPCDSQKEVIDAAYGISKAINVDMLSSLLEHKDEYIFYGTDHHWTSRGAYYGYSSLMASMGIRARDISDYSVTDVSDSFYGTTYSSSGFSWVKPDRIERWVEPESGVKVINYPEGSPVDSSLYAVSALDIKDKYSYFLGGNTPLVCISTGNEEAPKILILRDSYSDSLAPFLLEHFSEIHLIDLRYYRQSVSDYIGENDIDSVLVCYSVSNFSTDKNIILAGK